MLLEYKWDNSLDRIYITKITDVGNGRYTTLVLTLDEMEELYKQLGTNVPRMLNNFYTKEKTRLNKEIVMNRNNIERLNKELTDVERKLVLYSEYE